MSWYDKTWKTSKLIRVEMAIFLISRPWAKKMTVEEVEAFLTHMEDFTRSRILDLEPTTTQEGE